MNGRFASNFEISLQETLKIWVDLEKDCVRSEYAELISCPSCSSEERRLYFKKDGFQYDFCLNCQLVYMNPRIQTRFLKDFYSSVANEHYNNDKFGLETQSLQIDDQINAEIFDASLRVDIRHITNKRLLEVGPGRGSFLRHAQDAGFEVYGNELNGPLCDSLVSEFGKVISNCELQESAYPTGHFDAVYLRDVIEHIPNPRQFLNEVSRISGHDAYFVIGTHNIHGLIHRFVGKRHTVVFGFEHPVHWSPKSLGAALYNSGFQVIKTISEHDLPKSRAYLNDFTLSSILRYWLVPSFSTVQPFKKKLRIQRVFLFRLLTNKYIGLRNPLVSWLDQNAGLLLCRLTSRPSYFVLVAKKIQ
jgi:2-polyprenyl-3-methyl-5-hydroxy-6-metoxy-1,4-benzoquinol methylase